MPTATTTYLKDYQPPVFEVKSIHLHFDLNDEYAIIENKMELQRLTPGSLHLYGDEIELLSIHMNGQVMDTKSYRKLSDALLIEPSQDTCTLTIKTCIRPQDNSKLSGLYRTNHLFCTQCEAEGFRRITFFPDRPDVLTTYTTKITADKSKYPILLSNGNLIDEGDLNDGRHWVVWQDPFKKPSYLFALVAGQLVCVKDSFITQSGKAVDLRIYVEPGNENKCAHALASLKKAMRWDEEVYGREYDLSIFMIVAVSDFNMGAMENKGLNIFNAKYILASPDTATDQDYLDIESVVAHEYFHNWTGNRITCRDWFQLSLKEGLTVFREQEFSRDMNSRDLCRIKDVNILLTAQFPEDEGHMAHPVRPSSYQEINNFYTPTIYNKGAEVIRMQETLVGKAGFRRGMDLYFERHDGQAVTIDDFVKAMEDANQIDFSQFTRWYNQAGTPKVRVNSSFENNTLSLIMTQTCKPTPECQKKEPFHIPIRLVLWDKQGQKLPIPSEVLELRQKQETFQFNGLTEKPLVSLLRDFSAPIQLEYEQSTEERLSLLKFETNGYIKWAMAQELVLACLHTAYNSTKMPEQNLIPTAMTEAFRHVLQDDNLDPGLRSQLLTPPSFEEVIFSLESVDVDRIEALRQSYRNQLASALFEEASTIYQNLLKEEENQSNFTFNAKTMGQRKLRNFCLWLMMKAKPKATLDICQNQFREAPSMTDKITSFALLVNCPIEGIAPNAIEHFYSQWSHDPLVIDKWFAIQASSELPGTLSRVQALIQHPDFSLKNPNKVRAVIGAFIHNNPRHFHQASGVGYAFLGDILIVLDKINPQIAARLATPFSRGDRLDSHRRRLIQDQLTRLMQEDLSKDLFELVSKSVDPVHKAEE